MKTSSLLSLISAIGVAGFAVGLLLDVAAQTFFAISAIALVLATFAGDYARPQRVAIPARCPALARPRERLPLAA